MTVNVLQCEGETDLHAKLQRWLSSGWKLEALVYTGTGHYDGGQAINTYTVVLSHADLQITLDSTGAGK